MAPVMREAGKFRKIRSCVGPKGLRMMQFSPRYAEQFWPTVEVAAAGTPRLERRTSCNRTGSVRSHASLQVEHCTMSR